jgi:hypothetical protein
MTKVIQSTALVTKKKDMPDVCHRLFVVVLGQSLHTPAWGWWKGNTFPSFSMDIRVADLC